MSSQTAMKLGHYYLKETIGVGTFGKVKAGEHIILGTKVAIKIINRDKIKEQRFDQKIKREIFNMRRLHHPHIVQLYEVIETSTDIFMILEHISGGELFDYIISHGKLSESEGRYYFQQIISAMCYCHRHKVAHRDLKPENLLIDAATRTIKIADFGLSSIVDDGELLKTACGSPNYAAPEVISGRYYSGPEADVWSCGIILYALVTARLPFDDNYIPNLFNKIRAGKYMMPRYLSNELQDLIRRIILVNPVERLTMDEIRQHTWFRAGLAKYLDSAAESMDEVSNIDPRVVDEVAQKAKTEADLVLAAIERSRSNPNENAEALAVMYQILQSTGEYSKQSFSPPERLAASLSQSQSLAKQFSSSPPVNLRDEMPFFATSPKLNINIISAMAPSKKFAEKEEVSKLWYLGLISQADPQQMIAEVLKVLKLLGFEWKLTGVYQLRARPTSDSQYFMDSTEAMNDMLKIGVQIFAMPNKNKGNPTAPPQKQLYLLDLKRIEGSPFEFFDFGAKLLSQLKHLEQTQI